MHDQQLFNLIISAHVNFTKIFTWITHQLFNNVLLKED